MVAALQRDIRLARTAGGAACGLFTAMASDCEVQVPGASEPELRRLTAVAAQEAWRVEQTWSRYREDSIIGRINRAQGAAVEVDEETARLLDYGTVLYQRSEGAFDLSSGALRRVWRFDGSDRVPSAAAVQELMPHIGWHKADWQAPRLRLPAGMEIDFGGIGKEYAVDRALALVRAATSKPVLINFGGDLAVSGPRPDGRAWQVGIEGESATPLVQIMRGAVATSGDSKRYLFKGGVRYGHILDARSGWPVPGTPRSVTALAASCSEAGAWTTLAMLRGEGAEAYLRAAGVDHHIVRSGRSGDPGSAEKGTNLLQRPE